MWLETDEGYVFGPGVYNLLKTIKKTGTLKEASKELGMSYRYAWGLIKKAEMKLGQSLIEATKGGRLGGGRSVITELGASFITDFEQIMEQWMTFISSNNTLYGEIIKISQVDDNYEITIKTDEVKLRPGDNVKIILS